MTDREEHLAALLGGSAAAEERDDGRDDTDGDGGNSDVLDQHLVFTNLRRGVLGQHGRKVRDDP